jgi:hypothetical protein
MATCPLAAGQYTQKQIAGGTLKVSGLAPFPFPAGGTVVQDVGAATQPACVHDTVVPFPGGFNAPVFCIPALVFTVKVQQTGCGIGKIDSNGGSDFTVTEVGDTSAPSPPCSLPSASCTNGSNSNIRVDVTVGNGVADTCGGGGTANAIVSVPVQTTTWQDVLFQCPDADGTFDPGTDALITSFPQFLDFTTDATSADFDDTDPDGCCIAGSGPSTHLNANDNAGCTGAGTPKACCTGAGTGNCRCAGGGAGPQTDTGTCINLTGVGVPGADVVTVASGAVGSNGFPLYDLSFKTRLPNEVAKTGNFAGLTCAIPPAINFAGTAVRCIP